MKDDSKKPLIITTNAETSQKISGEVETILTGAHIWIEQAQDFIE